MVGGSKRCLDLPTPRGLLGAGIWSPTVLPYQYGFAQETSLTLAARQTDAFWVTLDHLRAPARALRRVWRAMGHAERPELARGRRRTGAARRVARVLERPGRWVERTQGCGERQPFGAAQTLLRNYCLELPSLQHRGGGRAAAARVRQPLPLVAGAPRDAVRAQRRHRRLLLLASALEQASAHPAPPPHTLPTWSTLGASARSGSSSSPSST